MMRRRAGLSKQRVCRLASQLMWFRDGGDGDGPDPYAGAAPPDLTRRQAKHAAAAGPPARRGNMAPPRHGRPRPWPGDTSTVRLLKSRSQVVAAMHAPARVSSRLAWP